MPPSTRAASNPAACARSADSAADNSASARSSLPRPTYARPVRPAARAALYVSPADSRTRREASASTAASSYRPWTRAMPVHLQGAERFRAVGDPDRGR